MPYKGTAVGMGTIKLHHYGTLMGKGDGVFWGLFFSVFFSCIPKMFCVKSPAFDMLDIFLYASFCPFYSQSYSWCSIGDWGGGYGGLGLFCDELNGIDRWPRAQKRQKG